MQHFLDVIQGDDWPLSNGSQRDLCSQPFLTEV
jgi:hypothetical protein